MNDKDRLEAELRGVKSALDELESEYKKGLIDLGRYLQLKTTHETSKAELEQELNELATISTLPENETDVLDTVEPLPSPPEKDVTSNDTSTRTDTPAESTLPEPSKNLETKTSKERDLITNGWIFLFVKIRNPSLLVWLWLWSVLFSQRSQVEFYGI